LTPDLLLCILSLSLSFEECSEQEVLSLSLSQKVEMGVPTKLSHNFYIGVF
jgi:hypothetical protein